MIVKTIFIKLLAIVALVEFLLMSAFHFIPHLSELTESLIDVFFLAVFSTPLIYILVLRPIEAAFVHQKKLEESMLRLSNQFIDNISHDFHQKIQSVLSITADAFDDISLGAIYEIKDGTYRQYHRYVKNDNAAVNLPSEISQNGTVYLSKILTQRQSLFVCQSNAAMDEGLITLFGLDKGCLIIVPMYLKDELEGFICFETFSIQEMHQDELLILMIAAQMIINAIKRYEIDQQLKKFSNALIQTGDAVCITDKNGIIEYVNPAFEILSKYSSDELIGKRTSIMKSGLHEDAFYKSLWEAITKGEVFHGEWINKDKNGILYHEEKTISSITNDEGEVTNYLSTGRDITQRKAMEHALRELATKDKLTNVFNRNQSDLFYDSFVGNRDSKNNFYLLLFDIDNFKHINDTFGHQQGDEVLRTIASCVQDTIRDDDILIRWGGEEFIVMTMSESDQKAVSFADRIREAVALVTFPVVGEVTISIGLTRYDEDTTREILMERADQAMYQAKKEGRNRVKYVWGTLEK